MTNGQCFDGTATYEITVVGRLGPQWSDWFEGFAMELEGGNTHLTGTVADQPALHGLLARIRDLGLPLLTVTRVSGPEAQIDG